MTATEPKPKLSPLQLAAVQSSAELAAYADVLAESGEGDELTKALSEALRRIAKRLWEAA